MDAEKRKPENYPPNQFCSPKGARPPEGHLDGIDQPLDPQNSTKGKLCSLMVA